MKKLTDLGFSGFSANRSMSDEKKNNHGNRLIFLHHRLGLHIVSGRMGNVKRAHKNEAQLLCIYFAEVLKRRVQTSRTTYNLCK